MNSKTDSGQDLAQAQQALWDSHQANDRYPEQWRGKLSVEQAYQVQLDMLSRKTAAGAQHTGWKVGLTADVVRNMYAAKDPVFGYLLQEGHCASGHEFAFADLGPPKMETEILVTLKSDLSGPDATVDDARAAIDTIAPAFEVVENRGGGLELDFPLGLVDNVSQRAYVAGERVAFDTGFDFADVVLTLERNGQEQARVTGRDVMDHQLTTIAWLANSLHRFGRKLEAGQCIMTGSFTKPAPVENGDRYRATFSGVGEVSMSFSG